MIEFTALPDVGRRFSTENAVRLSDADPKGRLRLDGVARFLQDVATDDWDDTGIVSDDTWVVRRTALRSLDPGRWPMLKDRLTLTTWCSGVGAAWAERRTNISLNGTVLIETAALWVPVDRSGHPVRVRAAFHDVYSDSVQGRKVSGRVSLSTPSQDAVTRDWHLRRSDLDVVGHVNNAAVWQAVSEVVSAPVSYVEVVHHGPVEAGHDMSLSTTAGRLWLVVDGEVRVSAEYLA